MFDSTMPAPASKVSKGKPRKPRPDFPLFPHATGRWAKKVRGKFAYFGKVADDPKGVAALNLWLDQKDDLLAGRVPRVGRDGLIVKDMLNKFLRTKRHLVDTGELTPQTFTSYHRTCERLKNAFGLMRLVEDVASDDFERLRVTLAKTLGPMALGVEIGRVKTVLKYAYDCGLIDRPIRIGSVFNRPSRSVLRKARNKKGSRMFEAAEIRKLFKAAPAHLAAMCYLGINCGYGNNDCGTLLQNSLDLDNGWANHPRPKTGVLRRCPLWPETVKAIRESLAVRPLPKDRANDDLVFVTKYGLPWATWTGSGIGSAVSRMTLRLLKTLDIQREGRGFYGLRHSFQTIAGDTTDQVAVDQIMGHIDPSMAANYRHKIEDERLIKVTEHVRSWLVAKQDDEDEKEDEKHDAEDEKSGDAT